MIMVLRLHSMRMRLQLVSAGVIGVLCASLLSAESPGTAPANEASVEARKAWRQTARDRQRRIIFNNDGNEPIVDMTAPDVQQFYDARTSALVGSQVDSIFYCTCGGFGTFSHLTRVGQLYTLNHAPHDHNQVEAMSKLGMDSLRLMTEFGKQHRMEVFWSFRMNDVHDKDTRDAYGMERFHFNKLKNEHPEYLLGSRDQPMKQGGWSGVNYGLPEVRELAFRYAEEVCRNYDVDGIELDFFRHPVFFKETTRAEPVTEKEREVMSELMRRIRDMADEVGRKRGRPLLIAMRVPDSVEYDRAIGLDIEKWLAEDLLDIMVVSGYFQLNDWDYSVALGHKYGVKVYPSLDESRLADGQAKEQRSTLLAYRGRAANVWASGADGVYVFNVFDPHDPLWRELGDARALGQRDRDYFGTIRGTVRANGGNLPIGPYQKIETLNPSNPRDIEPGAKATTRIQLGGIDSSPAAARMQLRLELSGISSIDTVQVFVNGRSVKPVSSQKGWFECELARGDVRSGPNEVSVALSAKASKPAKWQDLMVQVRN